MPKFPIFRFRSAERPACPPLESYFPSITLRGLQLGVDNLRYDVHVGARVIQELGQHLARYIRLFGEVDSLFAMDLPTESVPSYLRAATGSQPVQRKLVPADLKNLIVSYHLAVLNRAKADENPSLDLLGRLAFMKFLRAEMQAQFAQILEQCRTKSKSLEGLRQVKMMEMQTLVATFQIRKKIILRKASEEIFRLLFEIEKEKLARTRQSIFGEIVPETYRLFLNPLVFTENGRDDYLCAERYYMFGNFDKDPDRFQNLRRLALKFLEQQGFAAEQEREGILNCPENLGALIGEALGDSQAEASEAEDRACKHRLELWEDLLEAEDVLSYVIAGYETASLLRDYAPRINPQQIKHALVSREEGERVRTMIDESRLSPDRFLGAVKRVGNCGAPERKRIAARILRDVFCYHRDMRRLETVNSALDSINLIGDERVRELSTINGMLYEFMPGEDQQQHSRVVDHVILKADVRDSSLLTRSLIDKGMNPASYFSLNFYDPVNNLLAKYGAQKVFLEGDAIILALLGLEGLATLPVSRSCVLAWEILAVMRNCNALLQRSGLPPLEIGLGISYQDSGPLYLMDGERRIMISDAINAADRLSSCNKRARKKLKPETGVFQVYTLQVARPGKDHADFDEFSINYNVEGICLSRGAFEKLQQEIALSRWQGNFRGNWIDPKQELYVGTVPIGTGTFRKIVVRKNRVAQVDVRDLSFLSWSDEVYFEVCANPAVYEALPDEKGSAARG